MFQRIIVSACIIPALLVACSSSEPSPPPAETTAKLASSIELDALLTRASIQSTDFEQFKLFNGKLYKECGQIKRGRFTPAEQDLLTLSAEPAQRLNTQAQELWQQLVPSAPKLPEPGTNKNFADPGKVIITLRSSGAAREAKTSLDSVTNQGEQTLVKIKRLLELLRGEAGGKLCNNQTFYGLGSNS